MATAWQTFPVEFKGGLISNLSPLQHGTQAVGSASILKNYEPSLQGGYAKLKGYSKFNSKKALVILLILGSLFNSLFILLVSLNFLIIT